MNKSCTLYILFFFILTFAARAQTNKVTISGMVKDARSKAALPFVNITLKTVSDSAFVAGVISGEDGRFSLPDISSFLDFGSIELAPEARSLGEVVVTGNQEVISARMDKKSFNVSENISQAGGSALEAIKNLPGITTSQDGKVQLRGNEKVMILV